MTCADLLCRRPAERERRLFDKKWINSPGTEGLKGERFTPWDPRETVRAVFGA
jgi:hypothetical protein